LFDLCGAINEATHTWGIQAGTFSRQITPFLFTNDKKVAVVVMKSTTVIANVNGRPNLFGEITLAHLCLMVDDAPALIVAATQL
jgi:hypothetical protein